MPSIRRMPEIVLLAAFVAGGLIAPAVHQLEHAVDNRRQMEAAHRAHAGHDHDDWPALEADVDQANGHSPCPLCLVRWTSVLNGLAGVPVLEAASHMRSADERSPSAACTHLSIRAPPALS